MPHLPLSESLEEMLAHPGSSGGLTMNELLERTEGRGLYLMIIILCLPFVAPISLPGTSTPLGGIIFLLAFRLAMGLPPHLPKFIGQRQLPLSRHPKLVRGSVRSLRFIERWVKPRNTVWLSWRAARSGNAGLLAFMAFLLALPLPSPPFFLTNMLPAYAIVLIAASMMEEDGVLIWLGYTFALITVAYFAAWVVIILFFPKYYHQLHNLRFLQWLP